MSIQSEAGRMIKSGLSPNEVAAALGKTRRSKELKRLLMMEVGEGKLLLSQIFFSIPEVRRKVYNSHYQTVRAAIGEE